MQRVHFDHNATSRLRPEVRATWLETLDALGGNPSSLHAAGRRARHLLDEARERVACALGVHEEEVCFTSGGTEANNLALLGVLRAARERGEPDGLVTTAVEHSSVLEPARRLAAEGHRVAILGVGPEGCPDIGELARAAAQDCGLVSVQAANNEVGTRTPLPELAEALARSCGAVPLHTDAVQALGRSPLELRAWGVALATLAAHKVGGPVGVGFLIRRVGIDLLPLTFGGGQEGGLRPGTEDVAGIVAASLAVELAVREREAYAKRCRDLEIDLWDGIVLTVPGARLMGPPLGHRARQPGTLNVVFPNVDGKVLVTRLDLAGLEVSAGSACASGSVEPSHVLRALGLDDDDARAGVRFCIGRDTSRADVGRTVEILRTSFG